MKQWDPTWPQAARNGSDAAVAALVAHFMPLVRRGARGCICPGLDFEDAVQEGLIGLLRAVRSYRPDMEPGFEAYARASILNAQRTARRKAGRKKNSPLNQSVPLDEEAEAPGPEQLMMEREAFSDTLGRLNRELSSLERRVLRLRLEGCRVGAIARRLDITTKAAENALCRARRKIKRGK